MCKNARSIDLFGRLFWWQHQGRVLCWKLGEFGKLFLVERVVETLNLFNTCYVFLRVLNVLLLSHHDWNLRLDPVVILGISVEVKVQSLILARSLECLELRTSRKCWYHVHRWLWPAHVVSVNLIDFLEDLARWIGFHEILEACELWLFYGKCSHWFFGKACCLSAKITVFFCYCICTFQFYWIYSSIWLFCFYFLRWNYLF